MPDSVKELYTYNPDKAKKLLAEAGYPDGFTFKVQVCSCSPEHADLLPLVAGYLEQVGVKMEIQPMEYAAFLSAMTTRPTRRVISWATATPTRPRRLRKNFVMGQVWNPSQWNDPAFAKKMDEVYREPDEDKRKAMVRDMTREILDKAPYLWLPTPYVLHGLVAVGEELRRRTARRLGATRPDLRPHLDRPGDEEADGVLIVFVAN